MANTKKFSKTRKNSFKNKNKMTKNKMTKNKKTRKSTIFLEKRKKGSRKYYSFKKNKLIQCGGDIKIKGSKFSINNNEYICPTSSKYVEMLAIEFNREENKEYKKDIKKIAHVFLNRKNNVAIKYINNINFLVFMCYFFDSYEYEYIISKPVRIIVEPIHNVKHNPINTNSNTYLQTWVTFLNHKLMNGHTIIRGIIIETLKKYITGKINDKSLITKKLYSTANFSELSETNLSSILGNNNTAIEFILIFCSIEEREEIKNLIIVDSGIPATLQNPVNLRQPLSPGSSGSSQDNNDDLPPIPVNITKKTNSEYFDTSTIKNVATHTVRRSARPPEPLPRTLRRPHPNSHTLALPPVLPSEPIYEVPVPIYEVPVPISDSKGPPRPTASKPKHLNPKHLKLHNYTNVEREV